MLVPLQDKGSFSSALPDVNEQLISAETIGNFPGHFSSGGEPFVMMSSLGNGSFILI